MRKFKFLAVVAIAAATTVMTSCSKDDEAVSNPADGKLSFASQVSGDPQGRATSGNSWDGGETVKVNVSGTEYNFTAATSGTLTCSSLYWNDFTTINAYAYYPGNYAYAANQSSSIQAADFIFAEKVTDITRSNWGEAGKKLTFKHKTAKVTVVLEAGTGIANVSSATVKIYGYTAVNTIDNTGDNPTGAITGKTPGWITPNTAKTALLLPITYSSENIFEVTVGGKQYYYKGSYTFDAEKAYTFTVRVNNTGLTVNSSIADWGTPILGSGSAE